MAGSHAPTCSCWHHPQLNIGMWDWIMKFYTWFVVQWTLRAFCGQSSRTLIHWYLHRARLIILGAHWFWRKPWIVKTLISQISISYVYIRLSKTSAWSYHSMNGLYDNKRLLYILYGHVEPLPMLQVCAIRNGYRILVNIKTVLNPSSLVP